jgi:Ca2+-binding RTX toxin-like protein
MTIEMARALRMVGQSPLLPNDMLVPDLAPVQPIGPPLYNVIYGSNYADKIAGTSKADMILAQGGDDTVTAAGGSDLVDGGSGDDEIHGGSGNDKILGGSGNDELYGDSGDDTLLGGSGNDVFDGGAGSNWIEGGDGDDLLTGSYGGNVLKGGNGGDLILGYADMINEMWGGAGNDDIGGSGEIHGEDGNDMVVAGMFDDTIWGGADEDHVRAAEGDDLVFGEDGDDKLMGYEGDDVIEGGAGDDILYGDFDWGSWTDGGSDTLSGNAGSDTFVYFSWGNGGADTILDFEVDADVLRLADLVDDNDDGVVVGSALDGDLLLTFSNGASVELNGVQNPKIDTLSDLAQFITVDFG